MRYGFYTAGLGVALVGYAPTALYRRFAHGVRLHLGERLGWRGTPIKGPCGWVHAVSVGEAVAAVPIVEGLRRLYPDLPLVVTTVTETGAQVVRERLDGTATHRFFPLDFPGAVRRTLAALRPAFLICMETELWPNLLREAAAHGVPVMIANGRVSDRSYRRYRLVRHLLRAVLDNVRVFAMQSSEDARRVIVLGASPERVVVTGNVKHEAAPDGAGVAELWRRLLGLRAEQRVWIAGSTHRGEEALVLDAHREARRGAGDLVLVLAPRHPERVREVVELVQARGWPVVRRSELPRERTEDAVIVLDTVGELAQVYAVADVVFVGGSLVTHGGHNMLEPALRRRPVLFGPHTANFREAADLLVAFGAGRVVRDAAELSAELRRLLDDPHLREELGNAAYEAVVARQGAVGETLDLVARFLRAPAS